MASSEEESIEPVGFTLKIPKFQRKAVAVKKKRYGIKYKRPYSSKSQSDAMSLSPVKEDDADLFDIKIDSPCSTEATEKSTPSRKRKKRPRNDVLASISANAKRLPIPIPSFQMLRKKTEERSKKLRQLERAFFDEEDEDDENDSTRSNQREKIGLKNAQTVSDNDRDNAAKTINDQSSLPKEQYNEVCPQKESTSSYKTGYHDVDGIESNNRDSEKKIEPPAFHRRKRLSQTSSAEQHCSLGDNQIVENSYTVKEMVETSTPSKANFDANAGERIDNNPGNDEEEDEYDTNDVDFGGDDGGCDFDDVTEGDCQEIPSTDGHDKAITQTDVAKVPETTCMEATDIHNESSTSPSFDLDQQVDLLFQKTDTTAMSMNMFRKELERRIGVSLTKPEKKRVKARVLALLKGETVQSSDTEKMIDTSAERDRAGDERDTKNDTTNSTSNENMAFENANATDDNSKSDTHSKQDVTKENNPSEIIDIVTEATSISETHCEVEVINVECSSINSNAEEIEKERNISARSTEKAEKETTASYSNMEGAEKETNTSSLSKEEIEKETNPSSPNTCKAQREATISTREPIVKQKKERKKRQQKKGENASKNLTANNESNVNCAEIETEKPTNPEPNIEPKITKEKPKAKRQRKSKPKNSDATETSSGEPKAAPAKKPAQTRKRPRKAAACALCKTCPCQRHTTESDNIATLDMKNFSRSDDAVERTLIRRLQKLEKSTESMEEQTETVRRRLKKHRRDVAKRRERLQESTSIHGDKSGDSYFLPDAEVFERQQSESGGLPGRVVGRAQNRIFQNVPTYQPTLFEMMGIPRDSNKTKQNAHSEEPDGSGNTGETRVSHDFEEIGHDEDDNMSTEYVPERNCQEKIHRFEWNNGAREKKDCDGDITSGSIFETIIPFTQVDEEHDEPKDAASVPLWDDLFDSKKQERKQADSDDPMVGLDDLLCLFGDGTTESKDEAGDGDDRIDPTLLSQGAQTMANEVISSLSSDTLSASYPNWKENIYFAMMQKDPNQLSQALENVQESKRRLQEEKEEMLRAWECKHTALQVFEKALKTSFDRSKTSIMELEK